MRTLALLILLLIAAPMTRAQDSTWPPDPADIFAEGVEVVEIKPVIQSSLSAGEDLQIFVSPYQVWSLILMDDRTRDAPSYYAYNTFTGTLAFIGAIDAYMPQVSVAWLTATQGVIYRSGEWGNGYHFFDVTQGSGLNHIRGTGLFYEHPLRYESVQPSTQGIGYSESTPCMLDVYNLEHNQRYSFELAYRCAGVIALANGDYLYLGFPESGVERSTIYHLDIETGERSEILKGELETLENASPNGRYIITRVSDDGLVDRSRDDWMDIRSWNTTPVLADTRTKEVLYTIPYYFDVGVELGGHSSHSFYWLREDIVLYTADSDWSSLLLIIEGDTVREISLGTLWPIPMLGSERFRPTPVSASNPRYVLLSGGQQENKPLMSVFDIVTEQVIPLVESTDYVIYDPRWVDDNLLSFRILGSINQTTGIRPQMIYTIRIPQAGG